MKTYNFKYDPIPNGIKMFDKNGNRLTKLNQYGKCTTIEIYDTLPAIELQISYKSDYKNMIMHSGGGFYMPNPPENTGRYELDFINDCVGGGHFWRYIRAENYQGVPKYVPENS